METSAYRTMEELAMKATGSHLVDKLHLKRELEIQKLIKKRPDYRLPSNIPLFTRLSGFLGEK